MPHIFTGLAVGMGVAWVSLIAAEMISGQFGIGYFTWEAYSLISYAEIALGMITIGVLGLLCSGAIRLLAKAADAVAVVFVEWSTHMNARRVARAASMCATCGIRFNVKGGAVEAVKSASIHVRAGRVRLADRALGLRQVDLAQRGGRLRQAERRAGDARRRSRSPARAPTAAWCSSSTRCSPG